MNNKSGVHTEPGGQSKPSASTNVALSRGRQQALFKEHFPVANAFGRERIVSRSHGLFFIPGRSIVLGSKGEVLAVRYFIYHYRTPQEAVERDYKPTDVIEVDARTMECRIISRESP